MTVENFNTPSTGAWTCPAGVFFVDVEVWGPGGDGNDDLGPGGGGGGGGAYAKSLAVPVVPGNLYDYRVSAGNAAQTSYLYDNTGAVMICEADFGVAASGVNGGAGGLSANSTGNTTYNGGNGDNATLAVNGGGGGASGSSTGNGANGAGSVGGAQGDFFSGGGGTGGTNSTTNKNGIDGGSPGGGGGGGFPGSGGIGGLGKDGQVKLTYSALTSISVEDSGFYRVIASLGIVVEDVGIYASFPIVSYAIEDVGTNRVLGPYEVEDSGKYAVVNTMSVEDGGQHRVQVLADEGYVVYIGVDAIPDLNTPSAFSTTLPISFATTPPGSGLKLYYVVVRKRNAYGLESQNQEATIITIDSSNNFVRNAVPNPTLFTAIQIHSDTVRIMVQYPMLPFDKDPPDLWRIWYDTTPPDPLADVPYGDFAVTSDKLLTDIVGPWIPGTTYYFVVALVRSEDGKQSSSIQVALVIEQPPLEPWPVLSGYQVPPFNQF